ncbi:extracellular solute-binding protein [Entomobacter blattae]|uniref:Bacterial extracellular solute-binding protein n=1 Tax=Entomobacter blattae TaxID=2762277 RepID=A0A7H1NPH9_9PROT|nr:extracellular solute-binding protein [Entomobacter blattae]QNT77689.1 Bacterial extracellular solute-binding protein [Entomobacter blattae]
MLPRFSRFLFSFSLLSSLFSTQVAASRTKKTSDSPIKVMTISGALQEAQRLSLFLPFTTLHSSPRLNIATWSGQLEVLQDIIIHGKNAADLVMMDESDIDIACQKGLLIQMDQFTNTALPESSPKHPSSTPDNALASTISPCIIKNTAVPIHLVLSWDTKRFNRKPNWRDFWDISRNPGRRGLFKGAKGTLEIALLADNVAPEDIYAVLSTSAGVRRAFRKLNQIRPYISWWSSYTDSLTLLREGQVLMTSAAAEEIEAYNVNAQNKLGIQKNESLVTNLAWSVPAPYGRPLASGLDNVVTFISAPRQQTLFNKLFTLSTKAADKDPPSIEKPDHTTTKKLLPPSFQIDQNFWQNHYSDLQRRFMVWFSSP